MQKMVLIYFSFTTWENGIRLGLSKVQSLNFRFSVNRIILSGLSGLRQPRKVVIDECLPLRIYPKERAGKPPRRGRTFRPEDVEDYWALLLEKAFAKFVGGYMNLEGGFPRCAVTHLSGGITTSDMLNENNNGELLEYLQTDKVFNYLEDIEDDSMIILSNYEGPSSNKPPAQNGRPENMGGSEIWAWPKDCFWSSYKVALKWEFSQAMHMLSKILNV